ncbi:hypothetical protein ROW45_001101 [Vibrio fluvialis]|nr:hypothetical protein [Vibrio fluvialis]
MIFKIGFIAMLRESAVHVFLFKTAYALVAFLATALFTQIFALLPLQNQVITSYEMAQAEVNVYAHSEGHSSKDIALAQGKLNAAEKSNELISTAVSLLKSTAQLVFVLLWPVIVLGVGHWWALAIFAYHDQKEGADGGG